MVKMRQVTADNIPTERETRWFRQSVAVKVFLFAAIVALVLLLFAGYGLAMDNDMDQVLLRGGR